MRRFAKRRILLALALSLVLGFAFGYGASAVLAQGEEPPEPSDNQINAIAKNLYCPVCENVPLDVCPTQACIQWRAQIGTLLAEGYGEQEIYDYFVAQYGDSVLASPPAQGLNWLIYVVPPAALLLGGYLLYCRMDAWRKAEAPATPTTANNSYTQRVEEELETRR
jgi:cytochrome c-type biogenesis protein CcmH